MKIDLRPITAVVLAATATLALSACGSLDMKGLEEGVVDDAMPEMTLIDVDCDDVEAKTGAVIHCTAKDQELDEKVVVNGKITGEEDGKYATEYGYYLEEEGTSVATRARAALEADAGKRADDLTCPETVLVPTEKPVRCVVTVDGGTRSAST